MADIHVTPLKDLVEHAETRDCPCHPRILVDDVAEGDAVVVHHAADGRELIEEHGVN
jgi:hypothetical protein